MASPFTSADLTSDISLDACQTSGPCSASALVIKAADERGPRTNPTGLRIGSAFPENTPRAEWPPPPPPRAGMWKQMTLPSRFIYFPSARLWKWLNSLQSARRPSPSVHFPFQSSSAVAGITGATLTKNPASKRFFIPTHLLPRDSIFIKGRWINGRKQHNL